MSSFYDRLVKSFLLLLAVCSNSHRYNTLSLVQFASAWDSEGHQAVGMTAMSMLTGKAAVQVKRLMSGKDLVDVAAWAHLVETDYPQTASFHFQYQPAKWQCDQPAVPDFNCTPDRCLVRSLQHFYGRLTGSPNLVKLDYSGGLQLTDSDALRFFVNLMGELHQPLHTGLFEDLGGRNVTLFYINAKHEKVETSLFNYWDSALVQKIIQEHPSFWYGGWTHSHSLGNKLNVLRHEWENQDADKRHLIFEKWATESLNLACGNVYKDLHAGAAVSTGFEVSSTYEAAAVELIKGQILTAGARIGLVLNTILSERVAVKLRQGSGIEIRSEESRRFSMPVSAQDYLRSFCINLGIIFIVLALLAYVMRFYSTSTTITQSSASTRVTVPTKYMEKRS